MIGAQPAARLSSHKLNGILLIVPFWDSSFISGIAPLIPIKAR
jgi:hypothetical protein